MKSPSEIAREILSIWNPGHNPLTPSDNIMLFDRITKAITLERQRQEKLVLSLETCIKALDGAMVLTKGPSMETQDSAVLGIFGAKRVAQQVLVCVFIIFWGIACISSSISDGFSELSDAIKISHGYKYVVNHDDKWWTWESGEWVKEVK